jgi:hypothetical protein
MSLEISTDIDLQIRRRFLAKAFLSGGYLSYGAEFRSSVQHADARILMRPEEDITEPELDKLRTRLFDPFSSELPQEQKEEYGVQQAICSMVSGSLLVFMPSSRTLAVFGSVLGVYLGMLNVPADNHRFPNEGAYDLGHALIVSGGNVLRWSYRRLLGRLLPELEKRQRAEELRQNEQGK